MADQAGQLDWTRIRQGLATAGFALLKSLAQALADRVKSAVANLLRISNGITGFSK